MTAILITPPASLPVDLSVAKANMRVDGEDMDALITIWIEGIVAALEHEIGQCLIEQTWRLTLDRFDTIPVRFLGSYHVDEISNQIQLPHPAMSISSVKYFDEDGVEQTLAPSAYQLKVSRYSSMLVPARGASWPGVDSASDAVTIEVVCGFGSGPADVPSNVRLYILAKLVEQFDPLTRMERDTVQSVYLDRLLDACRSYA